MGLKSLLLGIGACCALNACSASRPVPAAEFLLDKPAHSFISEPNIGFLEPKGDSLFVNITDEHYRIKKSREEGEKDLLGLIKTAKLEEAFFYADYFDNERIWQECGYREGSSGATVDFKLAEPLINHRLDSLSFYHFHTSFDEPLDWSQTPSGADLYVCRNFMEHVNNFCPRYVDGLDCRVVVSTGVYTINVDSSILGNEQAEDRFLFHIGFIDGEMERCTKGESDEFNYSVKNRKNFVELNRKFCEKYSNELVKITFEELTE